ncbi:fluoride efflux transporter CrcB [Streptomyces cadmiisoli]|uniref:fluoride efflux transporter CrcB n=1 Tax=Streptomyces cadmiisoli TaxID=2184053 RepID=UPI003D74FFD7
MITLLGVAAAALGALARYVLDQYVQYRRPGPFPLGTWLINVSGSFVLGLLVGLGSRHVLSEQIVAIAGVGFCGGYTTFSTFSYELVRLCERGMVRKALFYGASSLAAGLCTAAAGFAVSTL